MDLYYTVAGALVIGSLLLLSSAVVYTGVLLERGVRALARPESRRITLSLLGLALMLALWVGLGSLSFDRAFERTAEAYVPPAGIDWEPVGNAPTTSFDRFDYGSVSNAALARRS